MSWRPLPQLTLWMAAGTLALGCQGGRKPIGEISPQGEGYLADMRLTAAATPLTVFPVVVANQPMTDVAEALVLLLEQSGMDHLEIGSANPPAGEADTFPQQAEAYAAWLDQSDLLTDYALVAEIAGTPRTGVEKLRYAVLHRSGQPVWWEDLAPGDAALRRYDHLEPLTCCVAIAERFQRQLGYATRENPDGKYARMWNRRTGLPDAAEQAAMESRAQQLAQAGGTIELVVYPVLVGERVDAGSARQLCQRLAARVGIQATALERGPHFELAPGRNEMKRLWDLARSFRSYLQEEPAGTAYRLYAEFMVASSGTVHAVHAVLCDAAGEWVLVELQNSHHEDFQRVQPDSLSDAVELLAMRLERYL